MKPSEPNREGWCTRTDTLSCDSQSDFEMRHQGKLEGLTLNWTGRDCTESVIGTISELNLEIQLPTAIVVLLFKFFVYFFVFVFSPGWLF